ncbi:bifunctional methionine sulfoxide reductase B/A protein [bacterium]|nr:bifunctional methionine sulfoxide reductase B/A protein [bacterium]
MKRLILILLIVIGGIIMYSQDRKLNDLEKYVIENKGTEAPFTGEYVEHFEDGTYHCKKCGTELFDASDKFHSSCGWPSFDDALPGRVKEVPDKDGIRTEIVCANCGGHLGHVFRGEGYTDKNLRHCVNSVSMKFEERSKEAEAYFAGGCFWGVEYYLQKLDGVISTSVGFMGGHVVNPGYYEVVRGGTGHIETTKVVYNPNKITYEELTKYFFEIHDPTQLDRQGPDIGQQYRSVIFYSSEQEKRVAATLIQTLKNKGYDVVTKLEAAQAFYKAENYHQDYYQNKGSLPYCHSYKKKF